MKDLKTVIFDLDGTILNTLTDLAESMNKALAGFGFPVHETEKYRYFVGNGVRVLCERVLPEDKRDEATKDALLAVYSKIYAENQMNKTAPYDGVAEAIKRLKAAGFRVAVLSNKPAPNSRVIVAHYFGDLFDEVRGQCDEFPRKPDPSQAFDLLEKLGSSPDGSFFVGDSGTDMETSVNAGMTGVGVLWGYRTADELLAKGAKALAASPAELADIIINYGK